MIEWFERMVLFVAGTLTATTMQAADLPELPEGLPAPEGIVMLQPALVDPYELDSLLQQEALPEAKPVPAESQMPTPEETVLLSRYADLELSDADIDMLAQLVWHESRGEVFEGQVAVAEVVLNRVLSDRFPNTVSDVIFAPGQFMPADRLGRATPGDQQYEAVYAAIAGIEPVTDSEVVYFATRQLNSRLYEKIGGHYFCYI